MQRSQWLFQYSSKDLAKAALAKVEHHRRRLKFWEEAKAKVMAEVKESGIEVSESEAGGNYSNHRREPRVMVRNDLQVRITECHEKIQEHQGRITEYNGWVQVLEASSATLPLNADDYLFFYGK